MRHEAFLQRLLVGKIKGGRELPNSEYEKIEKTARYVEEQLKKLNEKSSDSEITRVLSRLVRKVIADLQLRHWKPKITKIGESSWDQTFTEDFSNKNRQKTRAGIDDYFDELLTVEYVCTHCGKRYAKKFGVRED